MEDDNEDENIEEREERVRDNKKDEKKDKSVTVKKYNKPEILEKVRGNPWILSTFVLGALALILILSNFSLGGLTGNVSKDVASVNLMKFLGKNVPGNITLLDISKESGLYKVNIDYQGQEIPLYVTLDGKYMVSSPQPLDSASSSGSSTSKEIPKTDKPKVELFVMSFCPYGNEAENTLLPVYNLLKDKVEWNIHYIVSVNGNSVSSLHGQPEVNQDIRESCVLKNNGLDSFWKFVGYVNNNCGSDGNCWKDAAKSANLNADEIQSCFDSEGLNLMNQEADASNAAGVSGSPTMLINGVETSAVYDYGNSESYKTAICSAFNNEPSVCSTQLTSTQTAASGSC